MIIYGKVDRKKSRRMAIRPYKGGKQQVKSELIKGEEKEFLVDKMLEKLI